MENRNIKLSSFLLFFFQFLFVIKSLPPIINANTSAIDTKNMIMMQTKIEDPTAEITETPLLTEEEIKACYKDLETTAEGQNSLIDEMNIPPNLTDIKHLENMTEWVQEMKTKFEELKKFEKTIKIAFFSKIKLWFCKQNCNKALYQWECKINETKKGFQNIGFALSDVCSFNSLKSRFHNVSLWLGAIESNISKLVDSNNETISLIITNEKSETTKADNEKEKITNSIGNCGSLSTDDRQKLNKMNNYLQNKSETINLILTRLTVPNNENSKLL